MAGRTVSYGCVDGGMVLGETDHSQPVWTVSYLAEGDFASNLVDVAMTAAPLHPGLQGGPVGNRRVGRPSSGGLPSCAGCPAGLSGFAPRTARFEACARLASIQPTLRAHH